MGVFNGIGNRAAMFTMFGTLAMKPADIALKSDSSENDKTAARKNMRELMDSCPQRAILTICRNVLESFKEKKDVQILEAVKASLDGELKAMAINIQDVVEQAYLLNVSKISEQKEFDYDLELVYNHVIQDLLTSLLKMVQNYEKLADRNVDNIMVLAKLKELETLKNTDLAKLKNAIIEKKKEIKKDKEDREKDEIALGVLEANIRTPLSTRKGIEAPFVEQWSTKCERLKEKYTSELTNSSILSNAGISDDPSKKVYEAEISKKLLEYATSEWKEVHEIILKNIHSKEKIESVVLTLEKRIKETLKDLNSELQQLSINIEVEEKKDFKSRNNENLKRDKLRLKIVDELHKARTNDLGEVNKMIVDVATVNKDINDAYDVITTKEDNINTLKSKIKTNQAKLEQQEAEWNQSQNNEGVQTNFIERKNVEIKNFDTIFYNNFDPYLKKLYEMIQDKSIDFFDRFKKIITIAVVSYREQVNGKLAKKDETTSTKKPVIFNENNWFAHFSQEQQEKMNKSVNVIFKKIINSLGANVEIDGNATPKDSTDNKGVNSSANAQEVKKSENANAPIVSEPNKTAELEDPKPKIDFAINQLLEINVLKKYGVEHTDNWLDANDIIQNSVERIKSSLEIDSIIESAANSFYKKYAVTEKDLKKEAIVSNLTNSIDTLLTKHISNTIALVKPSEISQLKDKNPQSSFMRTVLIVAAVAAAVLLVVGFIWVAFLGGAAISTAGMAALLAPEFALEGAALVGIAATLALLITGASQKQVA